MSFGYYDRQWVDPDDEVYYEGPCNLCRRFTECPCGCGYGFCDDDVYELFDGTQPADECTCAEVD